METIIVRGARENNLKNINVEIPINQLVVIAGVSGSGKSSLAFQVLYGEGQRRLMDAYSTGMRRFTSFIRKPDVDSVEGLTPVLAVRQKMAVKNPRSTVGTMTEIMDYVRVLYANEGDGICPYCGETIELKTASQMVEYFFSYGEGTVIEISIPVFRQEEQNYEDTIEKLYESGFRKLRVNGELLEIEDSKTLEQMKIISVEAVVDQILIKRENAKSIERVVNHSLRLGEGMLCYTMIECTELSKREETGCHKHHIIMQKQSPNAFTYNNPDNACPKCMGLGMDLVATPKAIIQDENLSIMKGSFVKDAFRYDKNSFRSMLMSSVAKYYGFSLDTPFSQLSDEVKHIIYYGTGDEGIPLIEIENATKKSIYAKRMEGKNHNTLYPFTGLVNTIEESYKEYKKKGIMTHDAELHYKNIMEEQICINCHGSKLKKQRLYFKVGERNIDEVSKMSVKELLVFLEKLALKDLSDIQIVNEIIKRLHLLQEAGLGYICLDRKSDTLSGGELQRVKLTSHIGSGLRGLTYVLDEPSIGLHPRDNENLIRMMKKLRDSGNTVIVVEHDMETICNADYVIEMGPNSGANGGQIIAKGTIDQIKKNKNSIIGKYLNSGQGAKNLQRRKHDIERQIVIKGAKENNLKNIDVAIPLNCFVCITGVSGSGKSTLINEILYKRIFAELEDHRIRYGNHDAILGLEYIKRVVYIDQTQIGKNSRSIPATYLGIFDAIRKLFAAEQEAIDRKYTASRFSFNQKGGRCEECQGEGIITTNMHFMPSVESTCKVCNGARYNRETLEIQYRGKDISEVLDMSVAEAIQFFSEQKDIMKKLQYMSDMGLDYLKLGQSSSSLSGGESQRLKIAYELSNVTEHQDNLYILDEPTTGLHFADIDKLLQCIQRIVYLGNTVLVIEHNTEFIMESDYMIDLGPEGGMEGGRLVAYGTPKEVMKHSGSYTGAYMKKKLEEK
ncbi:excinuclease ABC subunit UvrA [Anaeromicropila populeti]|uniref:UvrABC system protein A n=1 Tax=Anaeromicropila populeti TaxID=37658 RepID=A0A1I6JAF4_9FIRM|nr:excinuclease ABC subunit UvrA [Anaeromicropila populeti]SFR75916.1 excinuclease ABC subunit A [Anaeromicropila populeti]